jgi:hypothetical protein
LAAITAVILLGSVFLGVSFVKDVMDPELDEDALRIAERHPELVSELGTPLELSFLGSSSLSLSNGSGTATFSKTLSGPKGSGRMSAEAEAIQNEWTFTTLTVTLESGEVVDVLETD